MFYASGLFSTIVILTKHFFTIVILTKHFFTIVILTKRSAWKDLGYIFPCRFLGFQVNCSLQHLIINRKGVGITGISALRNNHRTKLFGNIHG